MKDIEITVFKDLFKSTDVPYIVPLWKVLKRIQSGTSKGLIEDIRTTNESLKTETSEVKKKELEERKKYLKTKLPAILFNGKFSQRKKDGLVNHSGLMVCDYDDFETDEDLQKTWKEITSNKYTVFCAISPSGNGIKSLVKILECDAKTHSQIFKAFFNEYSNPFFDKSGSDVSRVCFETYDPNCYINYNAETYNPHLIEEGYDVSEKPPLLPINDESKIIELIMSFDWKRDFVKGERNNFVFDLAGMFCEYGVSENTAIGYISNNVTIGDFSQREVETTIKSAYKRRSFAVKYFEDYDTQKAIKSDLNKGKKAVIEKYKIEESVYDEIKEETEHEDFWFITETKSGETKINIDPFKYKLFLERNGFKKYFVSEAQKPTWVFISSNIVKETSVEKIKDFVLEWLMSQKHFDIWSYCAKYANLFSEQFLLMLETIELMMLKDTKYISYIAFKNGILEVSKDKVKLVDYIDVDGYIWDSQIIKREYKQIDNFDNEYQKFISNISSNEPLPVECVIGYLLSTYKNKMNNKAVILNDEVISDNPEGGTGKGLFVQGLKQIRKISILDGKSFDDKKSFPYQTVSPETNVLVFDDVKKNFDFESKFSLVTEGMTLERKNKDAIKLKVEDSPKMLLSTNYAIKGEGNSHDRRRQEIEIAQYYGKDLTPYNEFGRQLFDDWNDQEFTAFDNYMVYCLQKYLQNGLISQNAKNLKMRKFIAETAMEFLDWISELDNFYIGKRVNKTEAFENFTNEYPDYKKWLTRKKFNIWIQKYANFKDLKYTQGNTNGSRWIQIGEDNNDLDF